MGKVYKANDTDIKEKVAIKLMKPEIASDKKTIERFQNELKFARKISHRNVCRMYDLNKEKGSYYITMEYVEGEDLKSMIRMMGQLSTGKAISIAKQVCEGLVEAHSLGVIHRDLKPSNIMIDKLGNAKIMDFGIARSLKAKGITGAGVMIGTPEYMSPEQVEAKDVDQRSDIYSLGIILYEMTTGRLPFEGDTAFAIGLKHKSEEPENPRKLNSQIPEDLSRLILKCLEKDKENRYQSAGEVRSELDRIEKCIPTTERVVPKKKPITEKISKVGLKKFILYGGVAILLISLIVAGLLLFTGRPEAIDSIAVLPFTILGGDSDDQAFCEGLAETLSSKLIQLERFQGSLWAVPAHEVRRKGITSPSKIRQDLGVNLVVTGSVQRMGDMIRLTLNLVDTKTLLQLSSPLIFTDSITNLYTWQDDIVIKLVQMLDVELQPQMRLMWAAGATSLPNAYEFFLKGLGYMQQYKNAERLDSAISFFKRAIEQDSNYALAYAGLGKAFWLKYKLTKNSDWIEEAQSYCNLAIQHNDHLVPVYVTLGIIYRDTGRYEEAIKEFQRALQLEPKNHDAYIGLAWAYEKVERLAEAEDAYKKAIKLRPSYSAVYHSLGYFYYIYGQLGEAEKMFRKVTELTPGDIDSFSALGGIYFLMGQNELAANMFEKSIAIKPNAAAYSNLGTIYFYQRRYADSVAMYKEAINSGEKDYIIWGNLADAYRYTPGYLEKAREAYQRAIQLAEELLPTNQFDAQLRSVLAFYYAISGDYKKALVEISSARELTPNDVTVLRKCVQVIELANKRDRAILALQEYIERGGSMEEIRKDPDLSELRHDPRYQQLNKR